MRFLWNGDIGENVDHQGFSQKLAKLFSVTAAEVSDIIENDDAYFEKILFQSQAQAYQKHFDELGAVTQLSRYSPPKNTQQSPQKEQQQEALQADNPQEHAEISIVKYFKKVSLLFLLAFTVDGLLRGYGLGSDIGLYLFIPAHLLLMITSYRFALKRGFSPAVASLSLLSTLGLGLLLLIPGGKQQTKFSEKLMGLGAIILSLYFVGGFLSNSQALETYHDVQSPLMEHYAYPGTELLQDEHHLDDVVRSVLEHSKHGLDLLAANDYRKDDKSQLLTSLVDINTNLLVMLQYQHYLYVQDEESLPPFMDEKNVDSIVQRQLTELLEHPVMANNPQLKNELTMIMAGVQLQGQMIPNIGEIGIRNTGMEGMRLALLQLPGELMMLRSYNGRSKWNTQEKEQTMPALDLTEVKSMQLDKLRSLGFNLNIEPSLIEIGFIKGPSAGKNIIVAVYEVMEMSRGYRKKLQLRVKLDYIGGNAKPSDLGMNFNLLSEHMHENMIRQQ